MDVTIVGSGSPIASSRGGQSILITIDDEPLLLDCGPMTVERLFEQGVQLSDIRNLFITHQHLDHNSSFFHFAITSWMYGRQELSVYGPDGTESLLRALEDIYDEDIAYRKDFGRPVQGITAIDYEVVGEDFVLEKDGWRATGHPVDHSVPTYAYRFDERATGNSVVFSADTTKIDAMSEFAAGADVLIHDAAVGSSRTLTDEDANLDRESWDQYLSNNPKPDDGPVSQVHASPREAGEIAAAAGVDELVLTHFLPAQDADAAFTEATAVFDGPVHLAEFGLTIDV